MGNNSSESMIGTLDTVVTILILAALCILFKHIWHGLLWAFNTYIQYLRIK